MEIDNELINLLPSFVLPLHIISVGNKLLIRRILMEKYEVYNTMIEQRLFVEYMKDDLLNHSLYILKQEKKRRRKNKILDFLHIKR